MKKYVFYIITLLFSLNINIMNSQATDYCKTGINGINLECINICNYEFQYDGVSFYIRYTYKDNEGYLYGGTMYSGGVNGGSLKSIKDDYITNSDVLYMESSSRTNLLEKGICPKYVYLDNNSTDEFCLDDNGTYCKSIGHDITTDFNDKRGLGVLKDSLEDRITNFFENYFLTESMLLEDYDLETEIANSFSKNIMNGNQVPNAIKNMDAYINGFEVLKENLAAYKKEIADKYAKENAEGKISNEKLANINDKLDNNLDNQLNAISTAHILINNSFTSKISWENKSDLCTTYLGDGTKGTPMYYLNFAFKLIKYIALVLLFALTVMEYGKAVIADKDDTIKKANITTIKRLIIAIIIFFLPVLINFILDLLGISGAGTCRL